MVLNIHSFLTYNCLWLDYCNLYQINKPRYQLPYLHQQGVQSRVFYLCRAVLEEFIPVGTRDHNHDAAPLKSLNMYDKAHAITSTTACLRRMDPFIVLKHSLKFQFRNFLWLWLLSNDVDNMVIKRVHSQAYCKSVEEHMQLSFLIYSIF